MSEPLPSFRVMYHCGYCGAFFEVPAMAFQRTAEQEAAALWELKPMALHQCSDEGVVGVGRLAYVEAKKGITVKTDEA